MTTHPPANKQWISSRERPPVTLPEDPQRLADFFLGALLRGLGDGPAAARGGH